MLIFIKLFFFRRWICKLCLRSGTPWVTTVTAATMSPVTTSLWRGAPAIQILLRWANIYAYSPYLQCSGSMTFMCGSGSADPCLWLMDLDPGSGSCYFLHWPPRCHQKTNLKKSFSAYYFLKVPGTFSSFFNDKKAKRSHEVTKQYESRFFLVFLLDDRRTRIQEAQKHMQPTDLDPQHCRCHLLNR